MLVWTVRGARAAVAENIAHVLSQQIQDSLVLLPASTVQCINTW